MEKKYPIEEHLTRESLEIEIWNMLPDQCREILLPLKKSYIESLMADIDSYCMGKGGMIWVKAIRRLPKQSASFPCKCGRLYVTLEFNVFRGTFQNEVGYDFPMDQVEWLDESPSKESEAADPIRFHKWLIEHHWEEHSSGRYWHRSKDRHQWPPEETAEESELLKLYQQYNP
jgi:hypothetical protein